MLHDSAPASNLVLLPRHRKDLEGSGLSDQTIKDLGFFSCTSAEQLESFLHWEEATNGKPGKKSKRLRVERLGGGWVIQYRTKDGKPTGYYRVKPDHPIRHRKKNGELAKDPAKYESPRGLPNHALFPPDDNHVLPNTTKMIAFTEGEKKSLKLTQEGIYTIGLVGMDGWSIKRLKGPDGKPIGERHLLPELDSIPWEGRYVVIIVDSDGHGNGNLRRAAKALAKALTAKGAKVRILILPAEGDSKVGADDYLLVHSPDELRQLIDGAPFYEPAVGRGGLVYFCRGFDISVIAKKGRWQIAIYRGQATLMVDILDIASGRARHDLVRKIGGLSGDEAKALDQKFIELTDRLEKDWAVYQKAAFCQYQQDFLADVEKQKAAEAALNEQRLREMEPVATRLLDAQSLLFDVANAIAARGVVGERQNAILIFLSVLSQITDKPISIIVKGDSAGGKSFLVLQVLVLFEDFAHIDLTSMSPRFLIFDARDYAHRTVVIFEAKGQDDEFTSYLIRTLISEGCIRYGIVEATPEGMISREIVKQGPTNFVTTSTAPEIHAENETRIWSLLVDDRPEVTKQVTEIQAKIAEGEFVQDDNPDLRTAITWLRFTGATKVIIPFAKRLQQNIPDRPLRLRRDFPRLLDLISICAIFHQRQRQIDDKGRVVATLADYGMVREVVAKVFEHGVAGLTEKTKALIEALAEILKDKGAGATATYSQLTERTQKPKWYLTRWLRPAIALGAVDNLSAGERGKPAQLKIGSYQLDHSKALPDVEGLIAPEDGDIRWTSPLTGQDHCCTPSQECSSETATVAPENPDSQSVNGQQDARSSQNQDGLTVASVAVLRAPQGTTCAVHKAAAPHDGGTPPTATLQHSADSNGEASQPQIQKGFTETETVAVTSATVPQQSATVPPGTDESEFVEGIV
jgi:hypothetical protein